MVRDDGQRSETAGGLGLSVQSPSSVLLAASMRKARMVSGIVGYTKHRTAHRLPCGLEPEYR